MKVKDWLVAADKKLVQSGIETSRLDSLILLEDELRKDRSWLLANQDINISPIQLTNLNDLLTQRSRHKPLAYIRHGAMFYGRVFYISTNVLVPRPESEDMIDLLKDLVLSLPSSKQNLLICDVGCGSGVIGITAALELNTRLVDLVDIDKNALKVAKNNVDLFTLKLNCLRSDLLGNKAMNYDLILANLPYVPDAYSINKAAAYEPSIALFGGSDGLRLYKRLLLQLDESATKPLYLLFESFPSQHSTLEQLAKKIGYKLERTAGFVQRFDLQN